MKLSSVTDDAVRDMADAYRMIITSVGEDPARQGLLRTPERAAKAFLYFTKGYDEKIKGGYEKNVQGMMP